MEISDNYQLYISPCSKYKGYFEENSQPPAWRKNNTVIITAKEFLEYFCCVDDLSSDALDITKAYFHSLHPSLKVEFEPLDLPYDKLRMFIIVALNNDKEKADVNGARGEGYVDWCFLADIESSWFNFTDSVIFDDLLMEITGKIINEIYEFDVDSFFSDFVIPE